MKKARPHNKAEASPAHTGDRNSNFPRINTVRASILAVLFEGASITGMDAVFGQNTTRLAAHIHVLKHRYGCDIQSRALAVGTNDGRVVWVTAYWLPEAACEAAFAAGVRPWIDAVKAAAAKRRKRAGVAKLNAARLNALRFDPRQGDLFEGEA